MARTGLPVNIPVLSPALSPCHPALPPHCPFSSPDRPLTTPQVRKGSAAFQSLRQLGAIGGSAAQPDLDQLEQAWQPLKHTRAAALARRAAALARRGAAPGT